MGELQADEQRFSVEEVGELIDLAARLDELATSDGLLHEDLLRVADEVGISPAAIERAVVEDRATRRRMTKQARKRVRRRMRFVRHTVVYAVVLSSLLLIDALNGGGWWFYYVAALWGAALALQGTRFLTRRSGPVEEGMLERELSPRA
jgi:putative flippase GtrA